MTVRELIEKLQAMPQDMQVGFAAYSSMAAMDRYFEPVEDIHLTNVEAVADLPPWGSEPKGPCVLLGPLP